MKITRRCPICGSSAMQDFKGRRNARCSGCGSLERTRLLFLLLERKGSLRSNMDILHFAPEFGLAARLRALASTYVPADLEPERFHRALPDAVRIDLCDFPVDRFRSRFDLVVHMHVLEHVPCSAVAVLRNLAESLKPGGQMYFAVPIRANAATTENLDASLTGEQRKQLFGQHDHMRMFGGQDVKSVFHDALGKGVELISAEQYLSRLDIEGAFIDAPIDRLNGNSIFLFNKPLQ